MTDLQLPIRVDTGRAIIDLVVRAAGPIAWSAAASDIAVAAGLPATTELFTASGSPAPTARLGLPPLLAGVVFHTRVQNPDVAAPLVLDCVAGPDAGASIPVDRTRIVVGRSPRADLVIADPDVSARHARIVAGPDGISVTDLGSTNGSLVDRSAVRDSSALLPVGRLLHLGGSTLRVQVPASSPLLTHPDGNGRLAVTLPPIPSTKFAHPLPADPGQVPERTRHAIPVVAALAAAVAGVAIAAITQMWIFLLMAAIGPITMVASAVGDKIAGRRPHRRAVAEHAAATTVFTAAVAAGVAADTADAWERFGDPARLHRWCQRADIRLWSGRWPGPVTFPGSAQASGIPVVLSIGDRPARLDCDRAPCTARVPLITELPGAGVVGVHGKSRAQIRWLIAQLAGEYSPAAVRWEVLSTREDFAVLRDLPQLSGPEPGVVHQNPAAVVTAIGRPAGNRHRLVIIDDVDHVRSDPAIRTLLQHTDPGLLVVVIAGNRSGLPSTCQLVVDIDAQPGDPIGVSAHYLAELTRAICPLTESGTGVAALPASAAPTPPTAATIAASWATGRRPIATIGAGPDGPLTLDLAADGPHLLIAGTTGSGKSELLQTLVAGLATELPPDRLAFLLIDYKGGAAFAGVARLPHTAGIVTDLDPRLARRALTSLRAEIHSRERLLADAGATDLMDLEAESAPPRLVIAVDEFATLAAELPDFLNGLIDIAQRGRSLGLHLVLATQRPSGVVSPAIKANVTARIALRVTDAGDSTDVLDSPVAASLPADLPGRGFLRAAGGRLVPFQTYRVTAPSRTGVAVTSRAAESRPPTGPVPLDELVAIADVLGTDRRRPPAPWLPALPDQFTSPDRAVLGLIDLPDLQDQQPLLVPATSVLVAGAAGSGRTTAARRWAMAMAAGGGRLVVIDPGGGLLDLQHLPCTTTYLDGSSPALVLRLLDRVTAELALRQAENKQPPLGVVLDGWESVSSVLDQYDFGSWQTRVAELAGRGPAADIRVFVSGDARLSQHRVAASFGSQFLLGLPTMTGEPIPGIAPGRARIGGAQAVHSGAEIQLAVAVEPVQAMPAPGRRIVVRPLPALLPTTELPAPVPSLVPIGLGGDGADPVGVDLAGPGGGLLVAGPRRSGVSNTLEVLAAGARIAGIPMRLVVRWPTNDPAAIDVRQGVDPLLRFLADHEGPLLLVADEADRLVDDPVGEMLMKYVVVAGSGQYLAIGCRLDRAVRSHRGLLAEVAAFRTGVLLSADAMDGAVLDVTLPRRRRAAAPGRGHVVVAGRAEDVQVALFESATIG